MRKKIVDGKVALIVAPGFGAGWYSWHCYEELLFLPELIDFVDSKNAKKERITDAELEDIIKSFTDIDTDEEYFTADGLTVVWLSQGTKFIIEEYDGSERLVTLDKLGIVKA